MNALNPGRCPLPQSAYSIKSIRYVYATGSAALERSVRKSLEGKLVSLAYITPCFSVVGVLALSMVAVVMGSRGLAGGSNFANIEWNLWNVSGGVPLFSDMIL